MRHALRLRIGISRCLLGDPVRYDGGHKLDRFLLDTAGERVEWVPVCPEVEAGLGTPREPMQLVGGAARRLIGLASGTDYTERLSRFVKQRLREWDALQLSGFVLKGASPSCGLADVPIVDAHGVTAEYGAGLFAQAIGERFPLLPLENADRLHDLPALEAFLERAARFRDARNRI